MTGFGEIIEGYGELAEWFVKESSAEARRTATRIDAGTFDASAAASAAVRAVNLGLLGLFGMAGLTAGAPNVAKALTGLRPLPMQDDQTAKPRAFDPVVLTNDDGDTFEANANPNPLPAEQIDFVLVADIGGFPPSGFYTGDLNVRSEHRKIKVEWLVG